MNEEIDNEQLHDICSRLLKGFINWIEINDSKKKHQFLIMHSNLKHLF